MYLSRRYFCESLETAACRRLVAGVATHRVRPTRWMAPRSAGPPATSIMVPDLAASATQPMETAPNAGMRTYVHDLPFANLDQRRSAWAGSRKPRERQADHLESDHRSFADVMQYSANAEACRIAPLLAMIAYRSYTGSATHPSKATAQHPSATPSAPWISPEVSGLAASCQRVFAD